MTKRAPAKRPPIHMIDSEADTLTDLALARQDQSPALAELLLQEIDRANIYPAAKIPADTVTMHSRVEFVDEGNGQSRTVELVYPVDAATPAGPISVRSAECRVGDEWGSAWRYREAP